MPKNIINIISVVFGPKIITFGNILIQKYRTYLPVCVCAKCPPPWGSVYLFLARSEAFFCLWTDFYRQAQHFWFNQFHLEGGLTLVGGAFFDILCVNILDNIHQINLWSIRNFRVSKKQNPLERSLLPEYQEHIWQARRKRGGWGGLQPPQ